MISHIALPTRFCHYSYGYLVTAWFLGISDIIGASQATPQTVTARLRGEQLQAYLRIAGATRFQLPRLLSGESEDPLATIRASCSTSSPRLPAATLAGTSFLFENGDDLTVPEFVTIHSYQTVLDRKSQETGCRLIPDPRNPEVGFLLFAFLLKSEDHTLGARIHRANRLCHILPSFRTLGLV